MAPEVALAKRKPRERENHFLFEVGVKGRKTGITVPDTGIRDEHGLEPMDHLFSSPEKPNAKSVLRVNGTISASEDMEVDEDTVPEPAAVLNERRQASMRLPPPRSKSPIKTFLQSPARRNPSFGPGSSPVRPAPRATSISTSVRRKLDFSDISSGSIDGYTGVQNSVQKRAGSAMPSISNAELLNGNGIKSLGSSNHHNDEAAGDDSMNGGDYGNGDDSLQMVNDDSEIAMVPEDRHENNVSEPEDEVPEPEPEPEPKASKKFKGKSKAVEEFVEKVVRRGRPKKAAVPEIQEDVPQPEEDVAEKEERPKKRTRSSIDGSAPDVKAPKSKGRPKPLSEEYEQPNDEAEEQPQKNKAGRRKKAASDEVPVEEDADERPAKIPRLSTEPPSKAVGKAKKAAKEAPAKAKSTGRKPKLATIEEAESPAIQRGPPLPRNNNGLFIIRRETPSGGVGFKQTRSGRNSIKPVAYWKNERVEYEEDEVVDGSRKYLIPRIKEVIRAEEVEQPRRTRAKSRPPTKARRGTAEPESEDEDEVEPWEMEPGRIFGAVRVWDPEDPTGAEVDEMEEEVALSSAAIITRDIAGASFKFAKTLSYPFFGAGMVDLPPGAQKKPKNSRRMQMAFFVFYGRVKVTINDNEFRIGKGGMFQVPRGNFYSIENDYEKPARIFFSQGCELPEAAVDGQ